ncbi:hypothetical protein [Nocardiopsis baichengensis]|uniref:hypothetical protein n=1 Tax=Nocardiopsis baichengensis TaxID=280240 RepID=UPI00034D878D|nr:hypothetical protein [Nocardiopsis baichengensis]
MPFTSSFRRQAVAYVWPLFVLAWVLGPVAAVHGVGGALTHGHPDAALASSPAGAHGQDGHGHGVHSLAVVPGKAGDAHHPGGAGEERGAPTDASSPHAHADCLGVAASVAPVSLLLLLLLAALPPSGPGPLRPPRPLPAALLRRRGAALRFLRTRLRLARLSVLRV